MAHPSPPRRAGTEAVTAVDTLIADRAAESYIEMYESLCNEQQTALLMGDERKAARAGFYATIARSAVDAEIRHPDSPDRPYKLHCPVCTGYLHRPGRHD